MAFFKGRRKSDEEFKIALEREALEQRAGKENPEDSSYVLPYARYEGTQGGIAPKNQAPHVLTPEELLGFTPKTEKKAEMKKPIQPPEEIGMTKEQPTPSGGQFLFQRMLEARKQAEQQSVVPHAPVTLNQNTKNDAHTTFQAEQFEKKVIEPTEQQTRAIKSDITFHVNDLPKAEQEITSVPTDMPDSSLQAKKNSAEPEDTNIVFTPSTFENTERAKHKKTLLSKCDAFMCDEDGNKYSAEVNETYRLESVDSILKSFEERAIERANRRYGKSSENSTSTSLPKQDKFVHASGTLTSEQILAMLKQPPNKMPNEQVFEGKPTVSTKEVNEKTQPAAIRPELKEVPITEHKVYTGKESKIMVEATRDNQKTEELDFQFSYADQQDTVKPFIPKSILNTPTPDGKVLDEIDDQPEKTMQFTPANLTDSANTGSIERNEKFKLFHNNQMPELDQPDELPFESAPFEEELEDYTCVDDVKRVQSSLNKSRRRLQLRFTLTLFTAVFAVILATPLAEVFKQTFAGYFLFANAVLILLAILFNLNIVGSIASIFNGEPDMDLPASVASIAALLYSGVIAFTGDVSSAAPLSLVAIISLLFGSVGKLTIINRIRNNFKQIANANPKRAIQFIENQNTAGVIAKGASLDEVRICSSRKTVNITNFLRNSYCRDPLESRVKLLCGVGSLAAFILAVAVIVKTESFMNAFFVFTAALCLIAAPSTLFISNLPLKIAASRLNCYGAMLTGYSGADEIDACNATVIDVGDLFPEGTVKLVDMRLLSPNPIDQSLLAAAALTNGAKSPLAGVFKQITDTTEAKMPVVDSITYEENMGISGWVADRRVFVGNRSLLQTHGFTLPSIEVDKKILRKGFFPIYLASDGVPCALLIVKYTADDEIAYELRRLCNTGTTVLVNGCDPNAGADMICDYFGLYKDSVTIMQSSGVSKYKEVMNYKESVSSVGSYGNSVCGLASIITASINIKKLTAVMSALYIIFIIVGVSAVAVLSITDKMQLITSLTLSVYQIVTLIITCLPTYFKQP